MWVLDRNVGAVDGFTIWHGAAPGGPVAASGRPVAAFRGRALMRARWRLPMPFVALRGGFGPMLGRGVASWRLRAARGAAFRAGGVFPGKSPAYIKGSPRRSPMEKGGHTGGRGIGGGPYKSPQRAQKQPAPHWDRLEGAKGHCRAAQGHKRAR